MWEVWGVWGVWEVWEVWGRDVACNVRTGVWEDIRTFGGIIVAVYFCGSLPPVLTFLVLKAEKFALFSRQIMCLTFRYQSFEIRFPRHTRLIPHFADALAVFLHNFSQDALVLDQHS